MEAPIVEEKEELLDESKMELVREALKVEVKDELDVSSSEGAVLMRDRINMSADLRSRVKYIPMRLSEEERTLLGIVEGALDISEYTDHVDVSANDYVARTANNKEDVIIKELQSLCQNIAGLRVSTMYQTGGVGLLDRKLEENVELFQHCLEIGRRYKIMNPDKMRSTYGKLLYALMDNINPRIGQRYGMKLRVPVKTVKQVLAEHDALDLLENPLVGVAASEIDNGSVGAISAAQQEKKRALEELQRVYSCKLGPETLNLVISSISDNFSFLRSNRDPVDRLIFYLKKYFNPNVVPSVPEESLAIRGGKGGSKLTHSHETQYYFVLQSLTLWREIMGNFFKLWIAAEDDLLDERNSYRLSNTGQGLQRCQSAPRVSKEMQTILGNVRSKVGKWIGLSVVHLGDRDVPNALIFIDKYTQVPRILTPIVKTLDKIDELENDSSLKQYMKKNFQGKEKLRKLILADFFKHGFDGSGDDGGSCIDGRLTSVWNWCSKLEKKKFHSIFMLTNFQGFDGDFRS